MKGVETAKEKRYDFNTTPNKYSCGYIEWFLAFFGLPYILWHLNRQPTIPSGIQKIWQTDRQAGRQAGRQTVAEEEYFKAETEANNGQHTSTKKGKGTGREGEEVEEDKFISDSRIS
jgi:hypothetical protein